MLAFIGIPFTKETIDYLESTKNELLMYVVKANPTRKENFHLTLLFIGEISESEQEKIEVALEQISSIPKFNLKLGKFGTFNKGKDAIAWIGIKEGLESLNLLQQRIVKLVNDLGYNFPSNYQPHITLARSAVFTNAFKDLKVNQYEDPILIDKIHLYESHRVNNILTYTSRKTITLK
jgi:2'-5' RNA ligase